MLDFSGLPRFSAIRPEHIAPAVDLLLAENRALIERQTAPEVAATWEAFIAPLDDAGERLARAWGAIGHLHGVLDSPELREAYNANQPKIVQYYTEVGQNLALFAKYKALAASPQFPGLSPAQQRIVANEIRDFSLSGAELPQGKKSRFALIMEELAQITTRFSENLLDATNAFSLLVEDEAMLAGVPEDVRLAAREAAQAKGRAGWELSLRAPCVGPLLQYADQRELRQKLYYAHQTRASEFGEAKLDNTSLIIRILKLRREAARLLGYASHAEVSLVPKMAQTPREVLDFLEGLAGKALPFAKRDYAELKDFAATELGLADLQGWDISYAAEKLRAKRYAFSDQEVKQYFPEAKVLEGMFRVVDRIFGIRIVPDQTETWDPVVRFFRLITADGTSVGQFYLDLYARETKRGGAWMDEALTRRRTAAGVQIPVAYLICNFSAPVGESRGQKRPALFTHDEVITLFHEFGHGLHHMLSKVDYAGASGIHGVEWDAVELPSQFLENFCWEWEVLSRMTAHVDTGAALPRALYDKMLAARNFQSGMQMARQIEFSLFDMHLYHDFDPDGTQTPLQLLDDIRRRVAVVTPPAWSRFPNNFSHIFGGGYSAGYYSYKWAEVLSADAYAAFEEARDAKGDSAGDSTADSAGTGAGTGAGAGGVLNPEVGARFRDEILAVGGSRPSIESFRAFRGRNPSPDALLRHNGMIGA
ncbi:MAG: M3 family peptidase [Betaproteobacteria bacterium]|nr:M3 family peptidase [Betaproteobacteria bacterium]